MTVQSPPVLSSSEPKLRPNSSLEPTRSVKVGTAKTLLILPLSDGLLWLIVLISYTNFLLILTVCNRFTTADENQF
jgi:hypothetical protein